MSTLADRPTTPAAGPTQAGPAQTGPAVDPTAPPARAAGLELLGAVSGTGYRQGAALVRRADGQVVQVGSITYALLECIDGARDRGALAEAASAHLGRTLTDEQVGVLLDKLGALGLLAGTEHLAPAKRNPLLALRFKVLVTDPTWTRRITSPFTWLFSGWVMWPVLAAFAAVCWFVLIDKGVASATSQAFDKPGLLLLVFGLTVLSAGFHEFGHAAACRRGGATPGGMGAGLYLVWPAFYTDVTDAYRLPRRARLRVDLAGLYFNALVAVVTMAVWLAVRVDALLLLVALQLLQMVKQLSPVIRADGYHILADATGVPDLFAHVGPTLRRLLPGHRHEPSALTGRARLLVSVWVLVFVPVMLSLLCSAVLLLPRLLTTAYDSGRHIGGGIPAQVGRGDVIGVAASVLQLAALAIPVAGSTYVTWRLVRSSVGKGLSWSRGRPARRLLVTLVAAGVVAGLAYAWWPAGQYQRVRANERATLPALGQLLGSPGAAVRPAPHPSTGAVALPTGTHLALAMVPAGGASAAHPALLVVPGPAGSPATAFVIGATPPVSGTGPGPAVRLTGTAFPFTIPQADRQPGDSQALTVNTTDGAVTYDVAYSLVTVEGSGPVLNRNSAFALADCKACTTVDVSFQVVLVVGQHDVIAPIDAAGAENVDCPACTTTAIADQLVISLKTAPSPQLLAQLTADLRQLDAISALGAGASPTAVASEVEVVQREIDQQLQASGDVATPSTTSTTVPAGSASSTTSTTTSAGSSAGGQATTTTTTARSGSTTTSPTTTSPTTSGSSTTSTTAAPTTTTTSTSTTGG